jgi:hypothetical protein
MTVYLSSRNSKMILSTLIIVVFMILMFKYIFTGNLAKKSDNASKPAKFTDISNVGDFCRNSPKIGSSLNKTTMLLENSLSDNPIPCTVLDSDDKMQDLFYIGALKLSGQERASLLTKKKYDQTMTILDGLSGNWLEFVVIDLANAYAKDNGILDNATLYYNNLNRQADASKITQLKDTIRSHNEPPTSLLDETNTLLVTYIGENNNNFSEYERSVKVQGCYALTPEQASMSTCDKHSSLRDLTNQLKQHLLNSISLCNVTDPNNIVPNTPEQQQTIINSDIYKNMDSSFQLHQLPDECLNNRGSGSDTTTTSATTTTTIPSSTTTTIPSSTTTTIPATTTTTIPSSTTTTSASGNDPQYGKPTNQVGMNINEIGNSLSGVGEASSSLGYYGYGSDVINTPEPLTYDNGVDYRAMTNASRMNNGNLNVKGMTDDDKHIQSIVQKDMNGVSNIFAPRIIIKNYHGKPEDNEIKAYNA